MTYKQMLKKAEDAGACKKDMEKAREYKTLKSALASGKGAEWAYWYAKNIVNGRWKKAEKVISKNAKWAYCYAFDVIGGRWKLGENAISKNTEWAYCYAHDVYPGKEIKNDKINL